MGPYLEDNDVWLYQLALERMAKNYCPDPEMHGRFVAMITSVCTQARRANLLLKELREL